MESRLQLREIHTHLPTGRREGYANPFGSDFYLDLLKEYGLKMDPKVCAGNRLHTFEELSAPVLDHFVGKQRLEIDALVLAYYTPNCVSYSSTTAYLLHRYGMKAFAFAISDQETAAPITGIKLLNDFFVSGAYRRALLIAIDQTSQPTASPVLAGRDIKDAAVGLLVEGGEDATGRRLLDSGAETGDGGQGPGILKRALSRHGLSPANVALVAPWHGEAGMDWEGPVTFASSEHLVAAPFVALSDKSQAHPTLIADYSLGKWSWLLFEGQTK